MPRGDGTGPMGQGPIGGGGNRAGASGGRGRMGGSMAAGPEGYCVCPKCGAKIPHERGVVCTLISCPQCGEKMVRG